MIQTLLGYCLLLLVLFIVPIILGLPWADFIKLNNRISFLLYAFVMGFFIMLALLELWFFPAALFYIPFNYSSIIYSLIIVIALIISIKYSVKNKLINKIKDMETDRWTRFDVIYLVIFICLFAYQVYYAMFYSRTNMADDGYVAFSSAAYADNYINLTHVYTGEYLVHGTAWFQRAIQSFNYYAAYLSWVSGVNTAIIAHTVLYVYVVLLAYSTYYIMSDQLFKERDNRLIFISLICILFIWGYHSHYSLSFRLLGPNDSGKAILAVVLSPFVMLYINKVLEVGYKLNIGLAILILSIAACSLTLGGVYTFAALLAGLTVLCIIKKKTKKIFLYLLWGGTVPVAFAILFLSYKFYII